MGANQIASLGSAAPTAPAISVLPVISGATTVGSTLTTTTGTWTGSPTGYTYQWSATGRISLGATSNTYLLVTADLTAHYRDCHGDQCRGQYKFYRSGGGSGYFRRLPRAGRSDVRCASCFFDESSSAAQRGGTTKAIRICKNDFSAQQDIVILTTGLLDYSAITSWQATNGSEVVVMNWCNQLDGSGATDLTYGLAAVLSVISPPGLATGSRSNAQVCRRVFRAVALRSRRSPSRFRLLQISTRPTTGFRGGIVCGDGVQPKVGYENGSNTFFLEAGGTPHDSASPTQTRRGTLRNLYFNGASSHMNTPLASPTGASTRRALTLVSLPWGRGISVLPLAPAMHSPATSLSLVFGPVASRARTRSRVWSATPTAPAHSALPVITGTTTVGQMLTTTTGTWTVADGLHLLQWKRSGTNIKRRQP